MSNSLSGGSSSRQSTPSKSARAGQSNNRRLIDYSSAEDDEAGVNAQCK